MNEPLLKPDFNAIVRHFRFDGDFIDAKPFGSGHINDTYRARFQQADGSLRQYIIQRINHHIFKRPDQVMHNIELVTTFIRQKLVAAGQDIGYRTLHFVTTNDGKYFCNSPDGNYWRAYHYIDGARTYQQATRPTIYFEAAKAFGKFLTLLNDFPLEQLHATIPNFHNTPWRYEKFLHAVAKDPKNRADSVQKEIGFVTQRAEEVDRLVKLVQAGLIPERVTHNDTKIDNVMISDETGEGLCVIDLDTVMPGLSVFDFGDAVRSGANPAAEDEPDLNKVVFNLEIFEQLAHGFLEATRQILTPVEIDHLAFGTKLITLEQGIRFLTDHLLGDTYYKIQRKNQNLDRCRTQFKLVSDMETQYDQMLSIIERYQ